MTSTKKVVQAARQLFRLCVVDGGLDDGRVRQVAERLAASHRRGTLRTLTAFQRLVRLDSDRHSAIVESATALPGTLRAQIEGDLSRLYGHGLHASFAENAALIGGMRIKVGSDVYDGSVRARLSALESRL
jgi:F-type H+-transporting ATPase subunit delta